MQQQICALTNSASKLLKTLEIYLLCMFFLATLLLAVADLFMRTVFGGGLIWAQPVVRILVLWLGVLGAVYATSAQEHISVDVFSKLLSGKYLIIATAVCQAFGAIIAAITAFFGAQFVYGSYQYQEQVLTNFPAWVVQIIIPLGFGIIALRFGGQTIASLGKLGTTNA